MWHIALLLVSTLLILIWLWLDKRFRYWAERGVLGPRPSFPMGNLFVRFRVPPNEIELGYLRHYGRLYGTFSCLVPKLNVSDRHLVHRILVKDFHCFIDRDRMNTWHEVWNENLFMLSGDRWRHVRSIVSPTFSAVKLRAMHSMMATSVAKLCQHLDRLTSAAPGGGVVMINTKEVFSTFAIDVIATTTFSTQAKDIHDDQHHNAFLANATGIFALSFPTIFLAYLLPTWLNRLLGIEHIFPKINFDFFLQLAKQIVEERQRNNGKSNKDLVQLLLNATTLVEKDSKPAADGDSKLMATLDAEEAKQEINSKGAHLRRLTKNEVIAQCILFFIAGYETTASTLSYLLIELANNPSVQDRLAEEIDTTLAGVDINSEGYHDRVINGLPYLEAAIKETLRRYPPVPRLQRICTAPDGYDLNGLHLAKGEGVEIVVYALHNDPQYYDEPDKFRPERFLPENAATLVPYTFIPFGDGPRNCVGLRFAYQEMKLCLAQVLLHYRFQPVEGGHYPVRFENRIGMFIPLNTLVAIEKRKRL